jgi:hypothetical protein
MSRPPSVRELWLGLSAIAALWTLAAAQWVLSGKVVPWDAKNQSYAFFRFLASALHSGSTPFWNPYHYGGHPSVADPQSLIFAPAFLVWAWFDPTPSMMTFDLIVYAHLLVGGLALGMMGWRMGWPWPAVVLAAAVFMLGGPAAGRLTHTGMIISYGLFPPALLLMQLALERRSMLLAASFAVVAGLLVLERNHVSLLLSFVLAALFVGEVMAAERPMRWMHERWRVIATMAVVGVAIIVVPLLLTLQFAAVSNRPQVQLEEALLGSLYPANLANLAVANVMGALETTFSYWGPNYETLPEAAATDRSFTYLFVGATTMLLLMWLGVAGGGLVRRGRRLLTAVLVVALLYSLGRFTPAYALAFAYVPGIDLFRRPCDASFVIAAVLAILVGHLLADYARHGVPRMPWWRAACVGAVSVGAILWAIAFSAKTGHAWDAAVEVIKAAAVAIPAAGLLWWASRSASRRGAAAACVALLAAAELVSWNAASSLNAEPWDAYAVLERPQEKDAAALAILEREIAKRHREGERPRVEVVGVSGSWQNLAMVRGLEATNGYNPLRIGSYDQLVSPGETTHLMFQRRFPKTFDGYDCTLARALGLQYVVLGKPIEEMPHLARRPVAEVLMAGPDIWIYRLARAAPRVQFVSRVKVAHADAGPAARRLPSGPADALTDQDAFLPPGYLPALVKQTGPEVRIVSWSPDEVTVEVDARTPGVVVMHDTFYPGWIAEVDGHSASIVRTNVLFRGVEVREGRHTVVFRYRPFSIENLRDAAVAVFKGTRLEQWLGR